MVEDNDRSRLELDYFFYIPLFFCIAKYRKGGEKIDQMSVFLPVPELFMNLAFCTSVMLGVGLH